MAKAPKCRFCKQQHYGNCNPGLGGDVAVSAEEMVKYDDFRRKAEPASTSPPPTNPGLGGDVNLMRGSTGLEYGSNYPEMASSLNDPATRDAPQQVLGHTSPPPSNDTEDLTYATATMASVLYERDTLRAEVARLKRELAAAHRNGTVTETVTRNVTSNAARQRRYRERKKEVVGGGMVMNGDTSQHSA